MNELQHQNSFSENIISTKDIRWKNEIDIVLLAENIPAYWKENNFCYTLFIQSHDQERTQNFLTDYLSEELSRRFESKQFQLIEKLWLQPEFVSALGLSIIMLLFFLVTHANENLWFNAGMFTRKGFIDHQWWRLITATTLHADESHVLSNAGFFIILFWAAAERLGIGITLFIAFLTASAGFIASIFVTNTIATLGASGAVFGLLGAATGHAARYRALGAFKRREMFRSLGAGILLLAFTAFSPKSNISAHTGGFLMGLIIGSGMPFKRAHPLIQICLLGACIFGVWGAWVLALI